MDVKSYFANKLSKMLFLEIKKENIKKLFNAEIKEDIYFPVKASNIVDKVKAETNLEQIPISFFVEGMTYVLGADENFRFNGYYEKLICNIKDSNNFIKSKIAEYVKNEDYEEAYILLKGLLRIEDTIEIYDKLITIVDNLRNSDKMYKSEELEVIEKAKNKENYAPPYFYEALIRREEGDYDKALFCINNYISRGGKETLEITEFKHELKSIIDFEKGKEMVYDAPKEALKFLIPLIEEFGDNATLHYYIAIAYRILENYEKAIYYLNDAMSIDSNIIEVVNELGINHASLGNYETAIAYFRKAFEATKSVEICTNIIMCYLNAGDIKNAKLHLDIAKKLDPKDEIVIELEGIINNSQAD